MILCIVVEFGDQRCSSDSEQGLDEDVIWCERSKELEKPLPFFEIDTARPCPRPVQQKVLFSNFLQPWDSSLSSHKSRSVS